MAHAQKPDLVFQRNGRVHLYRRGCQFIRLLAAEECGSAVVMPDRPCPIQCTTAGYPLHSPFSPSFLHPCVSVCHHSPFLLYHIECPHYGCPYQQHSCQLSSQVKSTQCPTQCRRQGIELVRITGATVLLQVFLSLSVVSSEIHLVASTCGQRPSCVRRGFVSLLSPCRPALAGLGWRGPKKNFTVARTCFRQSWTNNR